MGESDSRIQSEKLADYHYPNEARTSVGSARVELACNQLPFLHLIRVRGYEPKYRDTLARDEYRNAVSQRIPCQLLGSNQGRPSLQDGALPKLS
jgi:hypothetical protein